MTYYENDEGIANYESSDGKPSLLTEKSTSQK